MAALTLPAQAQQSEPAPERDYTRGWYIGAQGALSMGEGDFSSFGADKFRAGGNGGVFGGYRFNKVWSLELNARWGQLNMAEQDCCFERGYWLGADYNRYHPALIPAGMDGWYYKDLMSRTFVQQYSLQANMNVLGFFNATKDSRWMVELSPMVSAVGTSSDILTKAGKSPVRENISQWHLGVGGALQVSYAATKNLNVGIYGDFTHLFNEQLDGMPELHSTNFMIDAGVRVSWNFGSNKRANKSSAAVVAPVVATAPVIVTEQPKEEVKEVVAASVEKVDIAATKADTPTENVVADTVAEESVQEQKPIEEKEVVVVERPVVESAVAEEKPAEEETIVEEEHPVTEAVEEKSAFPVIYFSFNSIWIEPSERAKVKEIVEMMKADKSIRVRVTGWGDNVGTEEQNKRVSLQRAEAVKRVLGQWLIPAERVETVGAGIKHDAQSREEARHAATIEITE